MWKLKVEGPVEEIYGLLNDTFYDQHVKEVETEDKSVHTMRGSTVERSLGLRTQTEPGVSEQFRCIAKSVQIMLPQLDGKVSVECGGDEGSMHLKVKVV